MATKAIFRYGARSNFGNALSGSIIVLAALEILTGVIAGAWLIADERQTCGGQGQLYALRCTTSNPYTLLGASIIVGTVAQGILLVLAGIYIHNRRNAEPGMKPEAAHE